MAATKHSQFYLFRKLFLILMCDRKTNKSNTKKEGAMLAVGIGRKLLQRQSNRRTNRFNCVAFIGKKVGVFNSYSKKIPINHYLTQKRTRRYSHRQQGHILKLISHNKKELFQCCQSLYYQLNLFAQMD